MRLTPGKAQIPRWKIPPSHNTPVLSSRQPKGTPTSTLSTIDIVSGMWHLDCSSTSTFTCPLPKLLSDVCCITLPAHKHLVMVSLPITSGGTSVDHVKQYNRGQIIRNTALLGTSSFLVLRAADGHSDICYIYVPEAQDPNQLSLQFEDLGVGMENG